MSPDIEDKQTIKNITGFMGSVNCDCFCNNLVDNHIEAGHLHNTQTLKVLYDLKNVFIITLVNSLYAFDPAYVHHVYI